MSKITQTFRIFPSLRVAERRSEHETGAAELGQKWYQVPFEQRRRWYLVPFLPSDSPRRRPRFMFLTRLQCRSGNIRKVCVLVTFCVVIAQGLSWSLQARDVTPIPPREYFEQVHPLLQNAQKSVRLIIYEIRYYPRFKNSPTNQLIQALIDAHKRGVSVEVIVEESTEHAVDNAQKNREAAALLEKAGVLVYFDSPTTTTHAKLLIIDDRYVVIGSTNWSYHAFEKNNEASVLIDSSEVAGYYVEYFEKLK